MMKIIARSVKEAEEHLRFVEKPSQGKTRAWDILASEGSEVLGEVRWYSPWRKYVLYTTNNSALFDSGCLTTIVRFLNRENENHREEIRRRKS